jgi:hypothetical protein
VDTQEPAIRIALPDLAVSSLIHAAGMGLINCLAIDLFTFINEKVSKELGPQWLVEMQSKDLSLKSVNYRDPALLFKHLALPTHPEMRSILRKPLNDVIPKNNQKDFYGLLDHILGERHLWFHQQIDATPDALKELAISVNKVAFAVDGLPVIRECNLVLDLFLPRESPELESETPEEALPGFVKTVHEVTDGEELEVGASLEGPFLAHSYTLTLSGAIKDRKAGVQLDEIIPEDAASLGAVLIARKPSGGRLRITQEGVIAAFFGEGWGYLARVTQDKWFPGHLEI